MPSDTLTRRSLGAEYAGTNALATQIEALRKLTTAELKRR